MRRHKNSGTFAPMDNTDSSPLVPSEEFAALPLVAFKEPFRKHCRRIEVRRGADGIAHVARWDIMACGERLVEWRCRGRTPEWFLANNGRGVNWSRVEGVS